MTEFATANAPDTASTPVTGPLSIVELSDQDSARWDDFVHQHPAGTFYHLAGWRQVFGAHLQHKCFYVYAERAGEIEAVLPLVQVKSLLFGNALISVPFLVYGGPLSANAEAEAAVVQNACDIAESLQVDHLELRNREPLQSAGDDWVSGATHVTFRKTIDPDPEKNLMAIPRKQRAMIRKGIKAGLRWEMDDDASRLYSAMLECKRNLGTPFFGKAYLQSIMDTFGDQVEVMTVLHGQDTVCSVLSFRYRDEILPYYGGGGDLARDLKGNDYMYWCVMEKACQEGVQVFDYGRSQIGSGAYRFKKHWGFEPEDLGYQYKLVKASAPPNLSPANPRYRTAVDMWKKLPLPVAAMLGPPLARRLG